MRVTAVELPDEGLAGSLSAEWANLTALTFLDLSDNGLSGGVPREVWMRLHGLEEGEFVVIGNPDLSPAPALNLMAVVTKEDEGTTEVALSWDDIGWYTSNENADANVGPTTTHKFKYRHSTDGETWGDYREVTMLDTVKGRASADVTELPASDTYSLQVVTVKTVLTDENDPATPTDATDDTVTTKESEVSQIDVIGPQTLTATFDHPLELKVKYEPTVPEESGDLLEVEKADDGLLFKPKAAGDVTVTASPTGSATSGSHTFPVEILASGSAPSVADTISDQRVDKQRRTKKVDVTGVFSDPTGQTLTYSAESSKPAIADISEDSFEGDNAGVLIINLKRGGVVTITVRATDTDRSWEEQTFRLTVRDVPPNNAPQLIGNIPDLTLYLDDAGTQVDMTPFFRDQDNEFLRLIPQSSNPMVVTATSVGRNVIFNVNGLGEIRMTIIAQDGAGATAFGSFTVTVLDPNDAPKAVGTIPPQTLRLEDPGLALSLGSYFTDADNDPLTYRAVSADKGVVTVEVTEAMVTLTAVAEGGGTVTVTATDPGGKSATQEILVTVLPANRPPEAVGQIPDQTLQYNDEPLGLDVTMYFTDPDGDELSYVGQGTDASVAEVRVHSTGLVRVDPISHGEIEVTVTARDPLGASVSQSFMVTVQGNLPPEAVGVIDDQVLLEGGNAVTINVTEYFSDPNGDELTYMGTSANPDAVQAVVIGGSSELVLRPFAPAEEVTITVTAMDPEGESAAQLVTVSVVAAAPPPTATPMPTATPEPTAVPEPTATPAPTATFVPTGGDGGFPVGLIIVLVLVLAGVAAAVFIIQRRR